MEANQIRKKFLNFFEKKGHKIIPSASLVPQDDPTVLFTTAGMQSLVPYLLGQTHPLGKRLANVQKCLRTDDIDEVGDDSHNTFFEMLGNWSLGDYFKKEAIEWSFEFLTKELNIPLEKLAVSVFEGEQENNILRDEESAEIWQSLGIPKERLVYLGREDNWWGPAGKTGPCGPDTEVFCWTGKEQAPAKFAPGDSRWVEVWNDVFMEYNKTEDGKFVPLKQKNVDTGMGLERITAVMQNKSNVFETDLFASIIGKNSKAERIIADHIRASVFILAEGIAPSNVERGYVLRRLIRRAIRYGNISGIAEKVIEIYQEPYPELIKNQDFILQELGKEEKAFNKTLERGLKQFEKIARDNINGKEAFDLYQSFGFPIEMTKELAKEKGIGVDENGFEQELEKHQELSRTAAAGKFKSGLADQSEKTIKYHTATHLLHSALRQILGDKVQQMGSNITSERLRFDFSFDRKLTEQEIKEVENLVNQKIEQDLEIKMEEMPLEQAQKQGALSFFREKYPDKVKVYSIQGFSKEICAGPHVKRTLELNTFKITKEQSSSAGIRRIRATLQS